MRYPWKKRIKSLAFVFSLCQCPRRNRLCLYLNLLCFCGIHNELVNKELEIISRSIFGLVFLTLDYKKKHSPLQKKERVKAQRESGREEDLRLDRTILWNDRSTRTRTAAYGSTKPPKKRSKTSPTSSSGTGTDRLKGCSSRRKMRERVRF